MAVSVTSQTNPYVDKLIVDTQANSTVEAAVFSGSGGTTYIIDIDNSNNSAACALRLYNNGNPTHDGSGSSTEPDILIPCPKQTRQSVTITGFSNNGATADGVAFGGDYSFACTTSGATATNTSPQNNVTVRIMAE